MPGSLIDPAVVDLLDLRRPSRTLAAAIGPSTAGSTGWSTWSAAGAAPRPSPRPSWPTGTLLHDLLIRTLQHVSLAFEPRCGAARGRFAIVSSAAARSTPPQGNAAYARGQGGRRGLDPGPRRRRSEDPSTAAAILVVKALVHDGMRAERRQAKFPGFTDVADLAEAIAGLWDRTADDVNGPASG